MRTLRGATRQIVRLANDASQAYRRAGRAAKADLAAGRGDADAHARTLADARNARKAVLTELARASRYYPWAAPWSDGSTGTTGTDPEAERDRVI